MEEQRKEEIEELEKQEETVQEEAGVIEPEEEQADNSAWKNKARPAIYTMAAFYLAYLSYQMFKQISVTSGSEQTMMIVFSILFAVIGVGGILFGLMAGYKNTKDRK